MKAIIRLLCVGLLSTTALGLLLPAGAADKPAPAGPKKPRSTPFVGKLKAVDKVNKTIVLEGKETERVFQITSQTRITKAGKPATLDDGVVGEEVAGSARPTAEGKLEAVSVRFGPKAPVAPKPGTGKKETEIK